MPFPYDALSSVAVELAPMSGTYGGFSACNINAVTKSGQNELFASGFVHFLPSLIAASWLPPEQAVRNNNKVIVDNIFMVKS